MLRGASARTGRLMVTWLARARACMAVMRQQGLWNPTVALWTTLPPPLRGLVSASTSFCACARRRTTRTRSLPHARCCPGKGLEAALRSRVLGAGAVTARKGHSLLLPGHDQKPDGGRRVQAGVTPRLMLCKARASCGRRASKARIRELPTSRKTSVTPLSLGSLRFARSLAYSRCTRLDVGSLSLYSTGRSRVRPVHVAAALSTAAEPPGSIGPPYRVFTSWQARHTQSMQRLHQQLWVKRTLWPRPEGECCVMTCMRTGINRGPSPRRSQ